MAWQNNASRSGWMLVNIMVAAMTPLPALALEPVHLVAKLRGGHDVVRISWLGVARNPAGNLQFVIHKKNRAVFSHQGILRCRDLGTRFPECPLQETQPVPQFRQRIVPLKVIVAWLPMEV